MPSSYLVRVLRQTHNMQQQLNKREDHLTKGHLHKQTKPHLPHLTDIQNLDEPPIVTTRA